MRVLLLGRAARQYHRGRGGGIGAPQQCRQQQPPLLPGELLQHIAGIGDGADGHHNQPRLERVDMKLAELLVGQNRQNHARQKQELGEGKNLGRGDAHRSLFERGLQIQQQQAGHTERGRNPEVPITDQRPHQERGHPRHLGGHAGLRRRELVPVRQQQKTADHRKSDGQRDQLPARNHRQRIPDQADQRKRAHSSERVLPSCGLVFLPLHPDQERQKQHQQNFYRLRRQILAQFHLSQLPIVNLQFPYRLIHPVVLLAGCPGSPMFRTGAGSRAPYNRPVISAPAHSWYLPACVAGTVLLLLVLIIRVRLHAALALMIAALTLGIASGMALEKVPAVFTAGVGNLMGHIAIILGLGAILGQLLARSGGATALGGFLVDLFGPRGVPWAMLLLGIVVGMPVFFEVGLILMLPLVVAAAERSRRPPILVAMPLLAGLSIMHSMVPPHPGAMLASATFHADLGRVIFLGLVAGIPAAMVAGPGLQWVYMRHWERKNIAAAHTSAGSAAAAFSISPPSGSAGSPAREGETRVPLPPPAGPARAAFAILFPIALIFLGSWADALLTPGSPLNRALRFAGYPDVALLIAVLAALFTLGPRIQTERHHGRELLRKLTAESFAPIANSIVILSAAGGLSGILRESGAAQATVGLAVGAHMPPLVLAWLLAAVVRISMGSATVATAVASGVLAPLAGTSGIRPELLVLATGSGSLILSHVNDSGFWLVQSLFNVPPKQTLATWSVLETVLSVAGLGFTLLLAAFLR